jgi:TRAP-type C4-dicarboxylate transport system permease small subunit
LPVEKGWSLAKAVDNLVKIYFGISIVMLFVLMLLGTADVLGRFILNKPIRGTVEWSEMLLAGIVFFAWAGVQIADEHVSVDMVIRRTPPWTQAMAKLFASFVALVIFILYGWQGAMMAKLYNEMGRLIVNLEFPLFPFQLMVPIGAVGICLVLIKQMSDLIRQMKEKD